LLSISDVAARQSSVARGAVFSLMGHLGSMGDLGSMMGVLGLMMGARGLMGALGSMMDALGLISMGAVGSMGNANRWCGRAACWELSSARWELLARWNPSSA